MLRYFQHTFIQQQIVIIGIALLLWLPSFIMKTPVVITDSFSPLYVFLVNSLADNPIIIKILAFVIYAFTIFLFNSVMSANRLIYRASSIGALIFVLMTSSSINLTTAYPCLFASPFILMVMHAVFLINQTEKPESYIMNIGYFLAIASMFYFPSIFLIIWVVISLIIMGYADIRYLLTPLTSMLMLYVIMLGISFIFGDFDSLIHSYSMFFDNISLNFSLSISNMIILIFIGLIFLVSVITLLGNKNLDKSVIFRKRVGSATILALMSLGLIFIKPSIIYNSLFLIMFAFYTTMRFSDLKRIKLANLSMIFLLIMAIVNQYLPLFGITI